MKAKIKRVLFEQQKRVLTHTVTFVENGGTSVDDIPYILDGYTIPEPSTSRQYYVFSGWFTNINLTNQWNFANPLTNNITLYAKWTPIQYSITYDVSSFPEYSGMEQSFFGPTTYNIETPSILFNNSFKTGYTATWSPASIPLGSNGNKTITLVGFTANQYTVTFSKNGGTGGTNSITVTYDQPMPAITLPIRAGFNFNGYIFTTTGLQYYTSTGASARNWDRTSNTTLTAQWLTISPGEAVYTTPGTYSWVAPAGVTWVSVVAIGGASYGGGGLGWKNNIQVNPGQSYTVVVGAASNIGANSYFINTSTVRGGAGGAPNSTTKLSPGGTFTGDGGGNGGAGYEHNGFGQFGGGSGGAGGYSGKGGDGAGSFTTLSAGTGGGGGGGISSSASSNNFVGYGGGVGIYGRGANGPAGVFFNMTLPEFRNGAAGSGGDTTNINSTPDTRKYGGGGTNNGGGAVRIIWGTGRAFPTTNVGPTT